MPCENYREALTEAAAIGTELRGAAREHLESCADCQAFFAEEQTLFTAIDGGVRTIASAEVPPDFLPRVRARLDEHAAPQRRWILAPAMLACAAVLLITFAVLRASRHDGPPKVTPQIQNARKIAPPEVVPLRERSFAKVNPAFAVGATHHHPSAAHVARLDDPLVLVPAGQREAVALLIASLRRDEKSGEVLMAGARGPDFPSTRISPLDVSPLELKPLDDLVGPRK